MGLLKKLKENYVNNPFNFSVFILKMFHVIPILQEFPKKQYFSKVIFINNQIENDFFLKY